MPLRHIKWGVFVQKKEFNEKKWTDLLYRLTGEPPPNESVPERATKRGLRIKEVHFDIKKKLEKGEDFTPADFVRSYVLLMLFELEYGGSISFPYEDVFKWQEFKRMFYEITQVFDDVFEFRRTKGRPNKSETNLLYFLGVLCRSHNSPTCNHRYACECNYIGLLADVLEVRLARNEEWHKRKGAERKNVFLRELKAAKTAVNRFWVEFYGQRPVTLKRKDIPKILEFISINDPSASSLDLR
jgi:phage pi2 protein 07